MKNYFKDFEDKILYLKKKLLKKKVKKLPFLSQILKNLKMFYFIQHLLGKQNIMFILELYYLMILLQKKFFKKLMEILM